MLSVAIRRKTIKYQSQRQLQRGPLAQKIIKNQYRHQTNKKKRTAHITIYISQPSTPSTQPRKATNAQTEQPTHNKNRQNVVAAHICTHQNNSNTHTRHSIRNTAHSQSPHQRQNTFVAAPTTKHLNTCCLWRHAVGGHST